MRRGFALFASLGCIVIVLLSLSLFFERWPPLLVVLSGLKPFPPLTTINQTNTNLKHNTFARVYSMRKTIAVAGSFTKCLAILKASFLGST